MQKSLRSSGAQGPDQVAKQQNTQEHARDNRKLLI